VVYNKMDVKGLYKDSLFFYIYFMTMHWCFSMRINPTSAYENMWIYYIHLKPPTCFRHLLWQSSGRCCTNHHWILLLLVEHRASMKSFQALWSPAIPLTSFRDLPVLLISSSTVLRHVLFGLPLLLYPWGFQSNVVFSISPASYCNVCPMQFHFFLFIWISIGLFGDSPCCTNDMLKRTHCLTSG